MHSGLIGVGCTHIHLQLFGKRCLSLYLLTRKTVNQIFAEQERMGNIMKPGATHAGVHTGTHLQHIAGNVMLSNILQHLNTAIHSVYGYRLIMDTLLQRNRLQNTAGHRIYTAQGCVHFQRMVILHFTQGDAFTPEPVPNLVEHEDSIHLPGS